MSYHENSFTNYDDYNPDPLSKPNDNAKPKTNPENYDKIKIVKNEIEKTKQETIITIDKTLRRGNELDNLIERAKVLEHGGRTYYQKSNKLKKQMWCDYCTRKLCLIGSVAVVLAIIILIIVLTTTKKHH